MGATTQTLDAIRRLRAAGLERKHFQVRARRPSYETQITIWLNAVQLLPYVPRLLEQGFGITKYYGEGRLRLIMVEERGDGRVHRVNYDAPPGERYSIERPEQAQEQAPAAA